MRVVELFAGVGGFRLGLEAASKDAYETVWANQWEPGSDRRQFAFRCYDSRFDTGVKVNRNIEEVIGEVPEHDLLVGGFPCQDYSVARTGAEGIEGRKGVLWWSIDRIIGLRRPRFVILENVDRLLKSPSKQRGRDFGIILRCLADKGYCAEWRVVDASDYGCPQRRRRTFVFAYRADDPVAGTLQDILPEDEMCRTGLLARAFPAWSVPKAPLRRCDLSPSEYPALADVSDRFGASFGGCGVLRGYEATTGDVAPVYDGPFATLGSVLEEAAGPEYGVEEEALDRWRYLKGSKSMMRTAPDGSEYRYSEGAIPFPDVLDRAGRTMLTSEGTVNRSSHIIEDPHTGRYRILTPVECERLNGFPDGWTDTGMTERQRYFCMGNALVVPLVTRMGVALADVAEEASGGRADRRRI